VVVFPAKSQPPRDAAPVTDAPIPAPPARRPLHAAASAPWRPSNVSLPRFGRDGHFLDVGADLVAALLPPRHPRRRFGHARDRGTGPRRPHRVRSGCLPLVGVTPGFVWGWRKALGVTRWGTEGSQRLHQELSERGAAATRGRRPSPETLRKRVQT